MAPYFPTDQDLFRVLQRELPEGVYPDGPPSAFFSTADNFATATVLANLYQDAELVYLNEFPQTTDVRINDWEIKVFGVPGDPTLSLDQRRQRVIQKIRAQPTLILWQILTAVVGFLPPGVYAQVVELGCCGFGQCSGPSWKLGHSRLSSETALGWADFDELNNPFNFTDLCDVIEKSRGWRLGGSQLGVTTQLSGDNSWQTISKLQAKAYTYEVRIFNFVLTGAPFQAMLNTITALELARSTHLVRQGLNLNQFALTVPVPNVDQTSGVDCITVDPSSTTGYSGLVTPFHGM